MKHGKTNWNDQALSYEQLVFCELDDTRTFLSTAGITGKESVLDVCCGPGRISVVAAERGCTVVGIDSAEKMIERAQANAEAFGVTDHCEFRLLDWDCILPRQNIEKADVVIASRCHAMVDVHKLSGLANERVMIQTFANAPSIPALKGVLFSGCTDASGESFASCQPGRDATGAVTMSNQPSHGKPDRPGPGPVKPKHLFPVDDMHTARAGCGYLDIYLSAYLAGFDPNVRIMPERFRKAFSTHEEAVDWICKLDPARAEGNRNRVALNAAPFLTQTEQGIDFCISTVAAIIWWDVRGTACWNPHLS